MVLYEINSLSRSGHHSMMNWLIYNLTGLQIGWEWKLTNVNNTGLFHLNNGGKDKDMSYDLIDENLPFIKELIVSYEDQFPNFTIFNPGNEFRGRFSLSYQNLNLTTNKRIIFIRDFYNLLASRYKSNQNPNSFIDLRGEKVIFPVKSHFIDLWKSHAKLCLENKVFYLKFEDWLNSPNKRNQFLTEVLGYGEIFGDVKNIQGTYSSFQNLNSIDNRISEVNIPPEIKNLINQDPELHYLIGALGYNHKLI